jgi:hypothetical protein
MRGAVTNIRSGSGSGVTRENVQLQRRERRREGVEEMQCRNGWRGRLGSSGVRSARQGKASPDLGQLR